MSLYKHGVYSEIEQSEMQSTKSLGTIPAYIGSAPIQRVNASGEADFDYSDYINKPILLTSYNDVNTLGLYSDDWKTYTLCEAIHAHFMNETESVSPIILINVLDPVKKAESATTKSVVLNSEGLSKVGYIEDPLCAIDELTITADGTEFAEGEVTYAYVGDKVKITIKKDGFTASTISVSYKQIAFDKDDVTAEDFDTALKGMDHSEFATGYIPNILGAPAFSSKPELHSKMIQKAIDKIGGKWGFVVVSDIPCDASVNTLALAKAWKSTNQYNSKFDKVCYPKAKKGDKIYHLSTLAAYTMQLTDLNNDDVPCVSPSNKVLNCDGAVLDDGKSFFMTEAEANSLNEVGITTMNIVQRRLRLWGSHMANYDFAGLTNIAYEDRADASVRMVLYLTNYLQYNFIDEIDTAFVRKDIDSVVTNAQQFLNSLVNEGKLLYGTVEFNEDINSTESMVNGDFVFNVTPTYTPNAKSLTFKTCYTTAGLSALTGGDE